MTRFQKHVYTNQGALRRRPHEHGGHPEQLGDRLRQAGRLRPEAGAPGAGDGDRGPEVHGGHGGDPEQPRVRRRQAGRLYHLIVCYTIQYVISDYVTL